MGTQLKSQFDTLGYSILSSILTPREVQTYLEIYDQLLESTKNRSDIRSDLSGITTQKGKEKITQIMRPSLLKQELLEMPLHQKVLKAAQDLMGKDMALDFDMLINKAPNTNAPTPWHQDEAYWIDMSDKRAVSCWVALDQSTKENGAMWFVPRSHLAELRAHEQKTEGGPLHCQAEEQEADCVELEAGSCSFHHGRTVHYSRGNSTDGNRRAFILNFRPKAMIEYERAKGFDHSGKREDRTK